MWPWCTQSWTTLWNASMITDLMLYGLTTMQRLFSQIQLTTSMLAQRISFYYQFTADIWGKTARRVQPSLNPFSPIRSITMALEPSLFWFFLHFVQTNQQSPRVSLWCWLQWWQMPVRFSKRPTCWINPPSRLTLYYTRFGNLPITLSAAPTFGVQIKNLQILFKLSSRWNCLWGKM